MSALTTPHRKLLESAVKQAHKIATGGAQKSLEALAVHEPDPYPHMDEVQRALRRKLRAQAKQLGDGESHVKRGSYEITHLVEKLAYDQWHRILFARYLLENDLLISPDHGVAVSLDDCEELAPSVGLKDAWAVAARFAAVELPEIFRADDPAGAVELPVEDRKPLIALVTGLPVEVFTAGDSLGWCYQFWQADKKEEVNKSGNKIGADEISPVTQLFTEDYMVDFLLDNTLGAWWAEKQLALSPQLSDLSSEDELRQSVTLPGCPWKYLRFIQGTDGKWTPAAGSFDGWPKSAAALRALDPCMGSGHFVVAMFERLVALRLAEEKMDEAAAVAAVIRENLFGLEIDPRCTQIVAFNLALVAWRRVGHCKLPAMNLACSGLAPNTREADWLAIAGDNPKLQRGMERLYRLFQKAAVLGSLINPSAGEGDLLVAAFHELLPLLEKALEQEAKDGTEHEMAVTARGLAKAAEILASQFTLVATNVPYLGRGKQDEVLQDYCERVYPQSKADLATAFVERCLEFCGTQGSHGTTALVTPQNWISLGSFRKLRTSLLNDRCFKIVAQLGPAAFQDMNWWGANTLLIVLNSETSLADSSIGGIDVSAPRDPSQKASLLRSASVSVLSQRSQLHNPDNRVIISELGSHDLLGKAAVFGKGSVTGDGPHYLRNFWEFDRIVEGCRYWLNSPDEKQPWGGREQVVLWRLDGFDPRTEIGFAERGQRVLGQKGVAIAKMNHLHCTRYEGELFDDNLAVLIPNDASNLSALWTFCTSPDFKTTLRLLEPKMAVTAGTFVKVPFDAAHWQKAAADKYPHGLPNPFSSDPTQWLFNGHPAGADQPLHVSVARLLGYQWPRQTGSSFPDCPALGPDGLEAVADDDGIVCLSATKGEAPAAERLRALLVQTLGKLDLPALLASSGPKGSKSESLEDWLRDEFFEQHCALFHNRPFIWHVWDGHKSGFSALLNYHKLTHAKLENLTYAYLGDWIRRQQAAVDAGESGSDSRLQAAKLLQVRLKLILEGEPPYDLFVRWKPLSKQSIGWHPDLNDGVRINIRPFMATDIPGGKSGAGLLRAKPNIKWDKDRGKEPHREKAEFPWFWKGNSFVADRVNDVNLKRSQKEKADP
ncbi:N-6 DNA methylase [Haloferula sp. BvORR071]|uniref:Eco57I restriction-modification methylase domain-containing protein n=1 Tax=Haloferula sp. BvORR071 TaxID=1396141 RepID=UPI0005514887|nr:N-6 DNA methylase [Haloferula sp. BvORR071]